MRGNIFAIALGCGIAVALLRVWRVLQRKIGSRGPAVGLIYGALSLFSAIFAGSLAKSIGADVWAITVATVITVTSLAVAFLRKYIAEYLSLINDQRNDH